MKHYINTFLENEVATKKDIINAKIDILCDFNKMQYYDERRPLVRKMLDACDSEVAMTRLLHDVLMDRESLDDLLKRKGVM